MTTYGLTSTGFVVKPAEVIRAEIEADQRAAPALGADWDTSSEGPPGQLNGVVITKLAELWELAGVVYRARVPSGATFQGLEDTCAITGTTRRAATAGTVTLSVTLNAGTTLAAGAVARVPTAPSNRWVTLTTVTNSGGSPAWFDVKAAAETAGAIPANAHTITEIATPVAGWTAVDNALDAEPGTAADTDAQLRTRRNDELQAAGNAPLDALRTAVARVAAVVRVQAFHNTSNITDPTGLPAHAIELLVQGGAAADIAAAIWSAVAGGIATYGNTSATVLDAGGTTRTVRFSRPTTVPIYAEVRLVVDPATYAGDTALKAAVAAVTAAQLAGAPIRWSAVVVAAAAVAGVVAVEGVRLGRSTGTLAQGDLFVSARELAALDTSRVTVVR
jgi:uncharacterized phage protein gp47/JayE